MHATLKNIVAEAPALSERSVVGRYLTYPAGQQARSFEGGLRTAGRYKRRGAAGALPLVTVITVCRNSAETLEQCFQSVFGQTHENIEHIVIDGASTDGTLELIRKHEHALDYCVSEPDNGLYQAMNKGLSLAAGDYVLMLNSDDWYATDCVESLVRATGYGCADFVSALAQYVDRDGNPVEVMRHMPYDDSVLIRMPLRHETMLLPAAVYNDIGAYDETYRIISDFQLTARLFKAGYTLYELQRPLIYFRNSGISNSDMSKLFAERARLIGEHFPFLAREEAGIFGDLGKLNPEQVTELVAKYPDQPQLRRSLVSYCRERKRTAVAVRWKNRDIRWPPETAGHPGVSVVLPVFNAQETLGACIDAVLAQSLRDFELICIDDGSSDGSRQIIESYRARDSRIVSLANEKNMGPGASRNKGVREARASYVFFVDSDDFLPPGALEALHSHAVDHDCDIVKGAYLREQPALDGAPRKPVLENPCPASGPVAAVRLAEMPELLRATEGYWSCLYRRDLARRVPYPTDMRVGEDSIFLVRAMVQAHRIGVIEEVVYRYCVNSASAMNTFTFSKYLDSLEWRRRAWHVLRDSGMSAIGDHLLQAYWRDAHFRSLAISANPAQLNEFLDKFRRAYSEAGISSLTVSTSDFLHVLIPLILDGRDEDARALMISRAPDGRESAANNAPVANGWQPSAFGPRVTANGGVEIGRKMTVATFCSMDHGGAGTGSQRRVAALRKRGIDARIFSLVVNSKHAYVHRIVPELSGVDTSQQKKVWNEVNERAVKPVMELSGYCARELFSLTESVLDFRKLGAIFEAFDVIHLHWVVGMLDYNNMGEVLSDKPVVWTLADMNAFTGGCHYSEGCDEFKRECRRCPLLGGESDLAHEVWKIKKQAYAGLRNLHIVCPSTWMAERVRESALLGDREIHYIPNAYPVERLSLTAKVVARIHLGLPLKKKLLLFGADSLSNRRKGGDLLHAALAQYREKHGAEEVEIVVFGNDSVNLPLPMRRLRYISNDRHLALVYSAADAYLLPSREDNAPLTVGEAMLCGTPVVAFPVGNVPSLVEHRKTGYIATFEDIDDFVTGIEWALDASPGERFARSAQCRIRASAFHDPAVAAARHEAVYRRALQRPD